MFEFVNAEYFAVKHAQSRTRIKK